MLARLPAAPSPERDLARRQPEACETAIDPARERANVVRSRLVRAGLVILITLIASHARAEPSDRTVFYTGLALAPPTYLVGVALHEGSHALAAKLVGASVTEMHLFPPGRDPRGNFRFGWTYVRGLKTKGDRVFFYIAPKLTDVLLLGGFAALVLTDAWPENRYGQVALTAFATGLWVDYAKDLFAFRKTNDVPKVLDLWCMRGWKQLPARLVYAATIVGLGFVVARGYERTFDETDPAAARIAPLVRSTF